VLPVKYELGFCIPEEGVLHSYCREHLKSHNPMTFNVLQGVTNPVATALNISYTTLSGTSHIAMKIAINTSMLEIVPILLSMIVTFHKTGYTASLRTFDLEQGQGQFTAPCMENIMAQILRARTRM
jgi:Na+/proline symporter